jgi:hypothetical protein
MSLSGRLDSDEIALCVAANSSRVGAIYLWTSGYFSFSLALDSDGLFLRDSAF